MDEFEKLIEEFKELSDEEFVSKYLAFYFKEEPHKIGLWILTKNPMFGGVSPAELFTLGRSHKVRKFVEASAKGLVA